jgi:hypothetical protein
MLLFTHGFSPGKLISPAFHVSLEWWPLPFLAHLCSHYKGAAPATSFWIRGKCTLVILGFWGVAKVDQGDVVSVSGLVSHTCTRQSDLVLWGTRSNSRSRIWAQSPDFRTLNIVYLWLSKTLVPDSWWFKAPVPGYSSNLLGPRHPRIITCASSSTEGFWIASGSDQSPHTSAESQLPPWEHLFHKFVTKVCWCYSVTLLNRTHMFYWCVVRWGSKNKHHKDTCLKEIGLGTILGFHTPMNEWPS